MKAKVLAILKPKAKDLGFTDDELMTVCESIANGLASNENVTDDDINAKVDAVLPFLKLSQSASNRVYERKVKQFEEDHKKKAEEERKKAEEEAKKKAEEEEAKRKAGEMPEWFKAYKEANDKKLAELESENATMKKAEANKAYMAKAKDALKDVDANYYSLMLKGKEFGSDDEVNAFVTEVTDGWNALVKARGIQALKTLVPPGGQKQEPTKPNDIVQQRINERKSAEAQTNSVVKGLPSNSAK